MPCACSVATRFKNFFRAGTLKKRSRASTVVPGGAPASARETTRPPSISMRVPDSAPCSQERSVKRDTAAMEGSASPRKP